MTKLSKRVSPTLLTGLVTILGIAAGLFFVLKFPAVEGLGDKVRLPVYHGALTWATLMLFAVLLVCAVWYLARGNEKAYGWARSMCWTVVLLWTVGSILGFMAAANTWDFTGSSSSPISVMLEDPRLIAQIILTCVGFIVLALPLIFESKKVLAAADIVFTLGAYSMLAWAMGAGKALHPDSPVMSSDEIIIKLIFFCIVGAHMVTGFGLAAMINSISAKRLVK